MSVTARDVGLMLCIASGFFMLGRLFEQWVRRKK
jgi:hypothetical protein